MKQQRPILFKSEMVQAILAGRKTQTRRIVKQKSFKGEGVHVNNCPYGQIGDQLWVRETFTQGYDMTLLEGEGDDMNAVSIIYKADGKELYRECPEEIAENWGDWSCDGEGDPVFKPSIHMPRWASRILLEITDIRVERLNDISEADAKAEGCCYGKGGGVPDLAVSPEDHFPTLWESINGTDSWAANPWVWVVEFKVVQGGDL